MRHGLRHPAERDPRALALEPHGHNARPRLEPDLHELQRLREDERRSERRVAGERQLRDRREDADACVAARLGREHEHCLGQVHFAREVLHRRVIDLAPIREDGELVAGQRRVREDIRDDVTERERHCFDPLTREKVCAWSCTRRSGARTRTRCVSV